VVTAAELAQLNVARLRVATDAPELSGFLAALDPVYRLAEACPGFVWRLPSGHVHQPLTRDVDGGVLVVNLSTWTSYEALHAFTYRSAHGGLVRRRAEWFLPATAPSTVLWWVPAGTRPTADDGLRRLAHLRRHGPTPRAFGLRARFTPDGRPEGATCRALTARRLRPPADRRPPPGP
jgi:hypothetical protein